MDPTASGLFHVENRDTAMFGDVRGMTRLQLQGSVRRLRAELSRREANTPRGAEPTLPVGSPSLTLEEVPE